MSKEFAQTVGNKRIAWLLAILAAFAVFATVAQFRDAQALPNTTIVITAAPSGTVNPGQTLTYTASATLQGGTSTGATTFTLDLPNNVTVVGNATPTGAGLSCPAGPYATNTIVCTGNTLVAGTYTVSATATAPASGSLVAATASIADTVNPETATPSTTATVAGVTGDGDPFVVGANAVFRFTVPAGLGYCTDAIADGFRTINPALDVNVTGGTLASAIITNTSTAVADTLVVTVVPSAATVTVSIETDIEANGPAGACATSTPVSETGTLIELRHMSDVADTVIGDQDVVSNVRGSRHTICAVEANTGIDLNGDGDFDDTGDVPAVAAQFPSAITLSNIVVTNGGGYASLTDTDPTFDDVRIFIGDGTATGLPSSTTTAGLDGASCISWTSTDAGDQQISILYTAAPAPPAPPPGEEPPPPPTIPQLAQFNASWDTDGDNNDNDGMPNDGTPNTSLIKEWNRLENSLITATVGGVPLTSNPAPATVATGVGAVNTSYNFNVGLVFNPATGEFQTPNGANIVLTDIFQGSHVTRAGSTIGKIALNGVLYSAVTEVGCAGIDDGGEAGVTLLNPDESVTGQRVELDVSGCQTGNVVTLTFTGSEPSPIGSGVGLTVTQTVTINFTAAAPPVKKILLAWAGQRVILEHDWRLPPGDETDGDEVGICPFFEGRSVDGLTQVQGQDESGVFTKSQTSPGNFIPALGGYFDGPDTFYVPLGTPYGDASQFGDLDSSGDNAQDSCISRALYESEDEGEVDIELFPNSGLGGGAGKVAFVIYYMKFNTVNVSLVTQVSKPTHNSSASPDYAPGNPWNASLDDADNAADWNVSRDILVRGRVTGWFVNNNPSGRAQDATNPLNVLPANRWVLPNDWALLAGGPADPADGTDAIGTAEQFRPTYDIMFAPNNTRGIALTTPVGASAVQIGAVVAPTLGQGANTAAAFRISGVGEFAGLVSGSSSIIVGATSVTFGGITGGNLLAVTGLAATPAVGTPIFITTGVPFEGPYSLLDIPGLAATNGGIAGAAASNIDGTTNSVTRDTILDDGDVDMWDAPMPPANISVSIRGTGFIKQVIKSDVYYLGTANSSAQTFPNPFYIANVPDSPFISAQAAGGGFLWDSWGNDGPAARNGAWAPGVDSLTNGDNGDGPYTFWQPILIGANSVGIGDSFTASQAAELTQIRNAYGDQTIARDLVVYSDNRGEFMVTANGDYRTDLTACATNVLAGGKQCKPGDKVGTGTITATADYPDFRKHFPVQSNAATVSWLWGGYKDVTIEDGESDQFKYVVFHAMDRDAFCSTAATGAVSLHPVLSALDALNTINGTGAAHAGDPVESVDFLIDSGEGIILSANTTSQAGINDGRQFATGVPTFSLAENEPALTGIREFPLSPLAATGQTDECQAYIRVSNSLLGVLNILAIAKDDEGNIGFDEIIDLQNTTSYTLNFRWSLITWAGADNIPVDDAISGTGTSGLNPGGNDISAQVTAIYGWNQAAQQWLGYFPTGVNVPGANDLTVLRTGQAYWFAIAGPSSVTWTIASNVD